MARFRLVIEYVGTRYRGWQIQKNARTVQGEITQALRDINGPSSFELYGSGRTDAGVHALMQVAHLDLDSSTPPERLLQELNERLPADINILSVEPVSHRFHARHGASGRSYVYQISRRRTAFGKPFVWWVKDALDVAAMRVAATELQGFRDFRAFTDDAPEEKSTRVLLERIEIAEEGDLILIRVQGSHFLWKMVRRIVGVLVAVGRGALQTREVPALLAGPSSAPAELTAPPSGLFLERVLYEGEATPRPLRAFLAVAPAERSVPQPAERSRAATASSAAAPRHPQGSRRAPRREPDRRRRS
jgi:tRNA pseudouridine38-40 synthase